MCTSKNAEKYSYTIIEFLVFLPLCLFWSKNKRLVQALFSTSPRKLKDEKTQNSKVSANMVKINAENKANKSKHEGRLRRLKGKIHG